MKIYFRNDILYSIFFAVIYPGTVGANPVLGLIISAAGSYMDKIAAKEHDQLVIDYAESILTAIDGVNKEIAGLKLQTCNIYKHQVYQDFAAFEIHLLDYAGRTHPELFIEDLQNLQWYITDIRKHFEDHDQLVACAIDQYDSYQLYLAIANLDLNLQYEYISKTYKIAYLSNPDGTLQDISTLDPQTQATLLQLINNDSQTAFKIRVNDILNHLSILDGSSGVISWKKHTDARFSGMKTIYPPYAQNDPNYVYSVSGNQYVIDKLDYSYYGWRHLRVYDHCTGLDTFYPFNCPSVTSVGFGDQPNFLGIDHYFNTTSAYFNFLKDKTEFMHYFQHPNEIYSRHKYEVYMDYAKTVYEPGIPIVKSWVDQIQDGSIVYPNFTVDNDLTNYVAY